MIQNIPLRGHRDSVENDAELAEKDGIYGRESKEEIETLRTMFRMAPECLMFYCFRLDFFVLFLWYFKVNCNINYLWLFMFYSMVCICKTTQWQHRSIRWQQAGHVEIYVVLIKTTSQVR